MKRILTIYLFLLLSSIGFGQTVVTKTGYCLLSETDADYQKAVDVALERAKTFAVMDVCGEDVSVFSISVPSEKCVKLEADNYNVVDLSPN